MSSMPKASQTKILLRLTESVMGKERWLEAIKLLKENISVVEEDWKLLWNLGWCYLKLEQMDEAQKYLTRAAKLAPKTHTCKFGLGQLYLHKKQYKRAASVLSEALQMKELYVTRISLALAYLAQGKIEEAENTHLDGIRLTPKRSENYRAYADFLSDVGREVESKKMNQKAKELERIN